MVTSPSVWSYYYNMLKQMDLDDNINPHQHHLCGDLQHNKIHHWIQIDITSTAKLLECSSGHHWYVQTSSSQQKTTPSILQHHQNGIGVTSNIHLGTSRRQFATSSSYHLDYRKDIHYHFDISSADIEPRKFTSGTVTSVLGVPLAFNSRTQSTVAISSAEAELYAIRLGISDSLHIYQLLQERQQNLQRKTFDFGTSSLSTTSTTLSVHHHR